MPFLWCEPASEVLYRLAFWITSGYPGFAADLQGLLDSTDFFWFWFKRQDLHGSSPRQPRAYLHRHFNPQPFIEGESRIITFFLSAVQKFRTSFHELFKGFFTGSFLPGVFLPGVLQRKLSYQEHYSSQESLLDQDLLILQGLWWLYSSLESGIWISSPTCS